MLSQAHQITATPHVPLTLLRRVADDSAFRARLQADPKATLASVGVLLQDQDLPKDVRLPETREIQSCLGQLLPDPEVDTDKMVPKWRGFLG